MIDLLHLKHLIATSRLAGPAQAVRGLRRHLLNLSHPELGLLREEDRMIDAFLRDRLGPESGCLDVGAHVGSMSWRFGRLAPRGRHVLIEASPRKAAWLARRFPDMTVHNVAATAEPGEASFYENLDRPGYSSLSDRASRGATREIRVTCARIDDLVPADHRVELMKIDVEGHELDALKGAAGLLRRRRPAILFEAGPTTDRDLEGDGGLEVFRFLVDEMGYAVNAPFRLHHRRPPMSAEAFVECRTYPFLAFNFIALPAN